jgi:pimeloyl-ACP methyl ester carboxylesterase
MTAVALVAGCSAGSSAPPNLVPVPVDSSTTVAAPVATTTLPPLPPPPPVGWSPCGPGLECGLVGVPVDYRHPGARTIGIALERRQARVPARRIGSLVINPGGPGDSGIDDLSAELRVLTPGLLDRFDIVSFDPRGVARSAPVHCGPSTGTVGAPAGPPAPIPDPVPQTDAARQALADGDRSYASACQRYSGDLLPFVGTDSAARDLDRIRAALGDDKLTFLGHSYGTLLGATYAELFPTRVRALVLDGAIDPALSTSEMSLAQAQGFEASLQAFFAWCAGSGAGTCPWRPVGDPEAALVGLIASARAHPLPAAGSRTVGPGEVYLGVLDTLYAQSFWPALGRVLAAASRGDGRPLIGLSDSYQRHGSSNAGDANSAITCVDHPVSRDLSTYASAAASAALQAPVFGPLFAWGALACGVWPVAPTGSPHAIRAPGSPAILVVGTTQDPATPYVWAEHLAGELDHGVLVGRQGRDHVAYYYSGCIRVIDEHYLIDGVTPPSGTVCTT